MILSRYRRLTIFIFIVTWKVRYMVPIPLPPRESAYEGLPPKYEVIDWTLMESKREMERSFKTRTEAQAFIDGKPSDPRFSDFMLREK